MPSTRAPLVLLVSLMAAPACSASAAPAVSQPSGPAASAPRVFVRVKTVQTPVPVAGVSHQTPTDQSLGVLGITLLRSADDASPLVLFQSPTPVDTPYNDGADTLLATVPAASLAAGTYSVARIAVAYSKLTVAAAFHSGSAVIPCAMTDVFALSAGTVLDGAPRKRGWWSSECAVGPVASEASTGEGASLGQPPASSRVVLDLGGPVAAYVVPVSLTIPAHIDRDLQIVFTQNTYEDLRWQDEPGPGYAAGKLDVTAERQERVTEVGANSVTATIEPVSSH